MNGDAHTLPSRWPTRRLKFAADSMVCKASDRSLPYIGLEQIESFTGRLLQANGEDAADGDTANEFAPGDVLFGKLRPYLAKAHCATDAGRCTSEALVLRPKLGRLTSRYLTYLCLCDPFLALVNASTYGAKMPRASWDFIGNLQVPQPTDREQRAIADFLDRRTTAIDALIEKKGRLIELLQEKRHALITQAVTKGLDPNVPMKDSGIEWLGAIPAQWPVLRIGYLARVTNGATPSRSRVDYWTDGTIPWLSSGKVNEWLVEEPSEMITERAFRESPLELIPSGSVVLGMIGQGKTRGTSALLGIDACINQNMAAIIPWGHRLTGRFLLYVLQHCYRPLRECGRGGQQDALNCQIIADFRIPVPTIDEQHAIAAKLDADDRQISWIIERIADHIEYLREYRQALITAAVTGQIDIPSSEAA